jgi:hypothetical protein
VAPFGTVAESFDDHAIPAMSRCAQGTSLAKGWRNWAPITLPAARPLAMFLTVGSVAVDLAVVARREGQSPDLLVHGLAGPDQPLCQLVIVGEEIGRGDDPGRRFTWTETVEFGCPPLPDIGSAQRREIAPSTTAGAFAAAGATTSIPIVVGPAGEQTMEQLAGNFAKPVGNVTGFTLSVEGQDEKCLQLLKEASPDLSRIGVVLNPDNRSFDSPIALNTATEQLGLVLIRVESRGAVDVNRSLSALWRPESRRSRYRIRPRAASAKRQYLHYLCAKWRLALARDRYGFDLPERGGIYAPDNSWRAAERAAGPAADEIRAGDKPLRTDDPYGSSEFCAACSPVAGAH